MDPTDQVTRLQTLRTPALILDKARMARNIIRIRENLARASVQASLRPHMKTAKSVAVGRMLFDGGVGPITVSTLKEAEVFAAAGFTDILYAVGVHEGKLDRVIALRRSGIDVSIITDAEVVAEAIAARSKEAQVTLPTFIEVDVDGHRAGVAWNDNDHLQALARRLTSDNLAGVLTHAGGSYGLNSPHTLKEAARLEVERSVCAGQCVMDVIGRPVKISVGSTPTALSALDLTGVTEVRAGVFMFMDLVMAGVGVCTLDDIAVSVLATVIGVYPDRGHVIVDAGWMALSRDRGTASQSIDRGYGVVCTIEGHVMPDVIVESANQEHGVLRAPTFAPHLSALRVGDKVRILPNHACATSAQHQSYAVVSHEDPAVWERWERFSGW